jgi:hypothetical protein
MPLDAQDKLRVETIEQLLNGVTAPPTVREQLVKSGSQMVRMVLEIVPPDSPLRERILQRFEDTIELVSAATLRPAVVEARTS